MLIGQANYNLLNSWCDHHWKEYSSFQIQHSILAINACYVQIIQQIFAALLHDNLKIHVSWSVWHFLNHLNKTIIETYSNATSFYYGLPC